MFLIGMGCRERSNHIEPCHAFTRFRTPPHGVDGLTPFSANYLDPGVNRLLGQRFRSRAKAVSTTRN